jgi:uncharacterized membrane protein YGL010W
MARLESLLLEYGESHQNPVNQKIHKLCVPVIEWSLLGILWSLPVPVWMQPFNWAFVLVLIALGYYLQFRNAKVMAASLLLMAPFWIYISFHPPFVLQTSIALFVIAWIGQFYGHKVEGKKPSFFRDIFFLLIGPLWVVHHFRKLTE